MSFRFAAGLTLLVFILTSGCAGLVPPMKAYDGAVRDRREICVIKGISQFALATDITIFDGKTGQFGFKEIQALPGRHTMTVRVSDTARMGHYLGWEKVTLDAEAGRTYLVHGQLEVFQSKPPKGHVFVWVTLEGNDQVITGTPPPQK